MPSFLRRSITSQSPAVSSDARGPPPPLDSPDEPEPEPPPPAWHPTLDYFDIYHLRQIDRDTQTLISAESLSSLPSYTSSNTNDPSAEITSPPSFLPSFTIKINSSAGLMNRKPDMLMLRYHSDPPAYSPPAAATAEVRFDRTSSRTHIRYPSTSLTQEMEVESSLTQKFSVSIDSSLCMWQPADGQSKRCMELRSTEEGLMACFTYANEPNRYGYAKEDASGEVGVLQVNEYLGGDKGALEQVLCSAVVLVERTKRRAMTLGMVNGGMESN